MIPVVVERQVRAAVGIHGANAGFLQAAHPRVGVFRGVVDVRPIEERRDARVDAFQGAGEVTGVDIVRPIERREGVQDLDKIIIESGVRRAASDGALPGVPVRVDQSRDDDVPADVDDLGIRLDVGSDLHDLVALDQDVAFRQVTNIRIHRDDGTAA